MTRHECFAALPCLALFLVPGAAPGQAVRDEQRSATPRAAANEPDLGQFIATYPDRYRLSRLPAAWPGLYQLIRAIHDELGTPLVSNGLLYVGPLFDAIDAQAAQANAVESIGVIGNLVALGPDGGFGYTWMYRLPGARELPSSNVQVCYEAVGRARGAGSITPSGEFIRTAVPDGVRNCTDVITRSTQ